eukprot:CAMPEP_0197659364 /NCGR_PEP_ID=MMETSP1338-20131121/47418_1 /TAXON_ID=43686 ORGANISM="Pelagodinium beii, Strain RCC1491" /NCGR_SAMPLE_ID=MMETSP1338 /ASSEMBLY_ACC=CAM_ASM_000754 /LENGTH=212 /DNA_ID=CAMNT_0043236261 /DNA_START=118 /DNA_END=753 /DNA_ORIENTATION=-
MQLGDAPECEPDTTAVKDYSDDFSGKDNFQCVANGVYLSKLNTPAFANAPEGLFNKNKQEVAVPGNEHPADVELAKKKTKICRTECCSGVAEYQGNVNNAQLFLQCTGGRKEKEVCFQRGNPPDKSKPRSWDMKSMCEDGLQCQCCKNHPGRCTCQKWKLFGGFFGQDQCEEDGKAEEEPSATPSMPEEHPKPPIQDSVQGEEAHPAPEPPA